MYNRWKVQDTLVEQSFTLIHNSTDVLRIAVTDIINMLYLAQISGKKKLSPTSV